MPASAIPGEVLRCDVARSEFDTVGFYLSVLSSSAAATGGAVCLLQPSNAPAELRPWLSIGLGLVALLVVVPLWVEGNLLWLWRRHSEHLEIDDCEIRWDLGYGVWRIPLEMIDSVVSTTAVRSFLLTLPGSWNATNRPPYYERRTQLNLAAAFWFPLSVPVSQLRRREGRPAPLDVAPRDRERFLEELANRCPHLERRGSSLARRAPASGCRHESHRPGSPT